jgi:hypothetical protein
MKPQTPQTKPEQWLEELIDDFETGYIANPAKSMDKRRMFYEKHLRSMLAELTALRAQRDELRHRSKPVNQGQV